MSEYFLMGLIRVGIYLKCVIIEPSLSGPILKCFPRDLI